jgi:hypothetical protein
MREHRRGNFRKVSTCENLRKFSITNTEIYPINPTSLMQVRLT